MKLNYSLPVLPENIIIFLDNCAFGLNDYNFIYHSLNQNFSIGYLKEEKRRLETLTQKLLEMDNWTTISEVVNEFKKGNIWFKMRANKIMCKKTSRAFKKLYNQREKTLELLKDPYRIANENLPIKLRNKIDQIYPSVEKIFKKNAKIIKNNKTDIKLITTTLAYASDQPTGIFSHDQDLIKTFVYSALELNLAESAYVIGDRFAFNAKASNIIC